VLTQRFIHGHLGEIFVVASGCTDRTEETVQNFMREDRRIKLLCQSRREGKASAVNLFLLNATGDVLILESGDTVPEDGALDKLVAPFNDPSVGMTGAHPIPINERDTFIGYTVHLMWFLHHKIAFTSPKLGELVAFRSFVKEIPGNTAVDEASIEAIVRNAGYKLCYVPDAIVKNKGPENVRDFIKQRRRIAAGHKHLLNTQNHRVSTSDPVNILRTLRKECPWNFRNTIWTLGAIGLEMTSRILGYYDYSIRKKNPFIWDVVSSAKRWNKDAESNL
jgi:cellulose synthase/poly-beta-1,6-N-acetylglucosamine synthase-like glycosyltransferase